jgi:hypothetical protein
MLLTKAEQVSDDGRLRRRITPQAATATALLLCSTMRSAARHVGDSLREGSGLPRQKLMSALAAKHSSRVFVGAALFRRQGDRQLSDVGASKAVVGYWASP